MPFTEVPFPIDGSGVLKGAGRSSLSSGLAYNTWVEPATGLIGPRPRWREIGPRYLTGFPNKSAPAAVIPFNPVMAGDAPGTLRNGELTVLNTNSSRAVYEATDLRYSVNPGSVVTLATSSPTVTGLPNWSEGYPQLRTVYSPDGKSAWQIIQDDAIRGYDQVVQVTRGTQGGTIPAVAPVVTVLGGSGVSMQRILSIAFAGGRLFALVIDNFGVPKVVASAVIVGIPTFVGGYTVSLAFQPDSAAAFKGGAGIMTMDGRRLLVYSFDTTLVYDIGASSLTLANSLPGTGTLAEGGVCPVGDQGLMLNSQGLFWITQEVFRTNYKPTLLEGVSAVAQEWYMKAQVTPTSGVMAPGPAYPLGYSPAASKALVSNYMPTWNYVFFSSSVTNTTLAVYLGDADSGRPPYASVWSTSWLKAWPVYRAPAIDTAGDTSANFVPMFMLQSISTTSHDTARISALATTELYDMQSNLAGGTYGETEPVFSAYAFSGPIDLQEKDTPRNGCSIRQTYLDIVYSHRDSTMTPAMPMSCWWTNSRRGGSNAIAPAIAGGSPTSPGVVVSLSDLQAALRLPPKVTEVIDPDLLAVSRVRVPYSSANGNSPRLVVYWPDAGNVIAGVTAVGVTWQPVKPNSVSY